jgi:hypothetical protein
MTSNVRPCNTSLEADDADGSIVRMDGRANGFLAPTACHSVVDQLSPFGEFLHDTHYSVCTSHLLYSASFFQNLVGINSLPETGKTGSLGAASGSVHGHFCVSKGTKGAESIGLDS